MQKLKSSITNMVLVLVGVSVIMGAVLAWVNNITTPAIAAINEKNTQDAIKAVLPGIKPEKIVDETKTLDIGGKPYEFILHKAMDGETQLGTAVESTTNGFGGDLKIMVGFDKDGNILGYNLLAHAETPGLGAKADTWFQKGQKGDIIGMNPGTKALDVKPSKGNGDVDAITASTITTRAFLNAVNNAYQAVAGDFPTDGATGATQRK